MSYDDWKCSPPCPQCGTPNCYCDEPEPEEPEPQCLPWDATNGLRCIVDGCTCNATWDADQSSDGKCPHHKEPRA